MGAKSQLWTLAAPSTTVQMDITLVVLCCIGVLNKLLTRKNMTSCTINRNLIFPEQIAL